LARMEGLPGYTAEKLILQPVRSLMSTPSTLAMMEVSYCSSIRSAKFLYMSRISSLNNPIFVVAYPHRSRHPEPFGKLVFTGDTIFQS